MSRKSRTTLEGGDRAGEVTVVAGTAGLQKALQQGQSLTAAALLAAWTGIGCEVESSGCWNRPGIDSLQRRQRCRWRGDRLGHARLPTAGPAITADQPADHAELGDLVPGDAVLASPGGDAPIAAVGPAVAGFLMAPKAGDTELAAGPLKHVFHHADSHHQGLTEQRQLRTQLLDAFGTEGPVAR
jgi:hypothetical protein